MQESSGDTELIYSVWRMGRSFPHRTPSGSASLVLSEGVKLCFMGVLPPSAFVLR